MVVLFLNKILIFRRPIAGDISHFMYNYQIKLLKKQENKLLEAAESLQAQINQVDMEIEKVSNEIQTVLLEKKVVQLKHELQQQIIKAEKMLTNINQNQLFHD